MKSVVFLLVFSIFSMACGNAQITKDIQSTEVSEKIKTDKSILILDVRTPGEFSAGHIEGAINIDANGTEIYSNIDKLDKNKTYIVYCRTKNRSGVVVNYMQNNGFKDVYKMVDGFSGWTINNLPFVR